MGAKRPCACINAEIDWGYVGMAKKLIKLNKGVSLK